MKNFCLFLSIILISLLSIAKFPICAMEVTQNTKSFSEKRILKVASLMEHEISNSDDYKTVYCKIIQKVFDYFLNPDESNINKNDLISIFGQLNYDMLTRNSSKRYMISLEKNSVPMNCYIYKITFGLILPNNLYSNNFDLDPNVDTILLIRNAEKYFNYLSKFGYPSWEEVEEYLNKKV